jgi:hypothetical protein
MVENHFGSTERTQSMAMNVTLKPQNSRPRRRRSRDALAGLNALRREELGR